MALTIDAIGTELSDNTGTVSTINYTGLTVGSGASAILVMLALSVSGSTITSMNWDSAGTNQACSSLLSASGCSFRGLLNPTPGNKNLKIVLNNPNKFTLVVVSFQGGNSSAITNHFSGQQSANSASGTALSVSITSAVGSLVFGQFRSQQITGNNLSAVTGTSVYLDNSNISNTQTATSYTSGASSVTMSATAATSSAWVAQGVSVNPAPAVFPYPPRRIIYRRY